MAVKRRQIVHQPDTLELLPLALSRPREALARARAVLAAGPEPYYASIAHQTIGIVLRDFGDVGEAVRELRTAVRLAGKAGSSQREADVLATLGLALVFAGRTSSGLAAFDRAVRQSSGLLAGRVLMRLALALWTLGRHEDALEALRPAVTVLRRAGDTIWEARALTARAFVHLALGSVDRGTVDIARAERLFAAAGQEYESAVATHNRGVIAFRSGDLPAALDLLDEAAGRYDLLGAEVPDLSIDRCAVLLAAGLARDALQEADRAISGLEQVRGQATKRAELLLTAAESALAAADARAALERAGAAHRLFRAQQRPWWRAHARLVLVRARFAAGMVSGHLLRQAERTAAELDALHADEASQAHLLAGRTALALARVHDADRHLTIAARARWRGPVLQRVGGWLAEALRAEAVAGPRQVLNACRQGLDLLDEHRDTLGASELRAQVTAHGAELAALAQRQALRAGRPRRLLAWSERWRATALAIPPVRPPDDHDLQSELAALREITRRLENGGVRGASTAALQRDRQRLEGDIRARTMRTRGAGRAGHRQFEFQVEPLLEQVGAAHLVQIVEIDGNLHALVCGGGRVRRFPAGRAEEAARELDFARFGLRRLAYNRPVGRPETAVAQLEATGRRLERAFLGQAARHLGGGPVVVVPPARLHAVPWALLPSLRDRVLSLAPSAHVWLRARRAIPPPRRTVVLVRGPDLGTGGAEVPALAEACDDMTVLGQGTATAQRVLAAIDGAWLVHIAAHGRFRASSPLFSALHLDDGPLTVHDLERLRRAPHRLVLSSCDSGVSAPAGADELLGLTSSLVPLGTVGIVASVLPVNDAAVVPLMLALHRRLRAGGSLAESLRDARLELPADPVSVATGWSFVALGAG
jgi:tetratricopeptide (TPR) repeat protein